MQPLIQPCDREIVQNFVRHHFEDCLILIVSNREPYIHTMRGDQINCEKSVGGLTVALDPVMQTVAASGSRTDQATPMPRSPIAAVKWLCPLTTPLTPSSESG